MRGKFISIEGIEGAGKSTQIAFIRDYLISHGKKVVITREPGGTQLGEGLRALLLANSMAATTELLLILAARSEHISQVIMPALRRGCWVISDRFIDATFAYQGGGRGIDYHKISKITDWALNGLQADITFLLDLAVELGQKRMLARKQTTDRFEQENADFFQRIRDCYLDRAQYEPERIKVINADRSVNHVTSQIVHHLDRMIL